MPAQRAGKRRWADKCPDSVHHLDFVHELFAGDARFIVIVRHGFDVAASLDELVFPGLVGHIGERIDGYLERSGFRLEACCRFWLDEVVACRSFVRRHPHTSHVVKYEDLVGDPEKTLDGLFAFLGESWDPTLIEAAFRVPHGEGVGDLRIHSTQKIETDRVGRWRRWDPAVVATLAPIVAEGLLAFGYEAPLSKQTPK